jgi:electron transport complex protein RnfC
VPHRLGLSAPCIVIDCDGEDELAELQGCADFRARATTSSSPASSPRASPASAAPAFPPRASSRRRRPRRSHADHQRHGVRALHHRRRPLMRERAAAIVEGIEILAHMVQPDEILIGVEDNKPEAIAALRAASATGDDIEVVVFPTKYPSGGEKQLIEILTGKQVPSGGLPADIGILCQNVGTAARFTTRSLRGRPLVSRVTTVTGEAASDRVTSRCSSARPCAYLLERGGLRAGPPAAPDHGRTDDGRHACPTPDCPVIKTTNCLLVPAPGRTPRTDPPRPRPASAAACAPRPAPPSCCRSSCTGTRGPGPRALEEHNLFDCIECGACSYVCPSTSPWCSTTAPRRRRSASSGRRGGEVRAGPGALRGAAGAHGRAAAEKEARRAAAQARGAGQGGDKADDDDPIQARLRAPGAHRRAPADRRGSGARTRWRDRGAPGQGPRETRAMMGRSAITAALEKGVAGDESEAGSGARPMRRAARPPTGSADAPKKRRRPRPSREPLVVTSPARPRAAEHGAVMRTVLLATLPGVGALVYYFGPACWSISLRRRHGTGLREPGPGLRGRPAASVPRRLQRPGHGDAAVHRPAALRALVAGRARA